MILAVEALPSDNYNCCPLPGYGKVAPVVTPEGLAVSVDVRHTYLYVVLFLSRAAPSRTEFQSSTMAPLAGSPIGTDYTRSTRELHSTHGARAKRRHASYYVTTLLASY